MTPQQNAATQMSPDKFKDQNPDLAIDKKATKINDESGGDKDMKKQMTMHNKSIHKAIKPEQAKRLRQMQRKDKEAFGMEEEHVCYTSESSGRHEN